MSVIHLTANSRLTQVLKQKALEAQSQSVIVTPQIMTLNQWWDQWEAAALLKGELDPEVLGEKVLTSFESQMLWEQVLEAESAQRERDGETPLDLLNPSSTAKQLSQAWALWMGWLTPAQREELEALHFQSGETALFQKSAKRYQQKLETRGWQDEIGRQLTRLHWLAQGTGTLPDRFELHGFDEIPPLMAQWQALVQKRGCEVIQHDSDAGEVQENVQVYAAHDPLNEVRSVADWSVRQWLILKEKKPPHAIKIAVVAPGLGEVKQWLTSALDEQLVRYRQQSLHLQSSVSAPLYNVSLGASLSEVPLVKHALQTLKIFLQPQRSCTYDDWSEWLISPYASGMIQARQKADVRLRRLQWASFKWPVLLESQAAEALPAELLKRLGRWHSKVQQQPATGSLETFVQQVESCLEALDWCGGRTLNSEEFQQKTALIEALSRFQGLATASGKQSPGQWLSVLQRFIADRVHQPQSRGLQPIQIMGVLEAGGQQFDALWVMGLTDQAWPRLPDPNPFLPVGLQRRHGLPRCDAARELEYARNVTRRLRAAAPDQVWSYARFVDEAEMLPSPLLESSWFQLSQPFSPPPCETLAEDHYRMRGDLQWILDAKGPEVPKGSHAPGGTGILQAQSQCPLMAFIDYRLGARQDLKAVEEGLQSTHQGILIHEILECFWQEVRTQGQLFALDDEAVLSRLTELVDERFEALKNSFDEPYLAVERSRILALLLAWLEVEKSRPAFAVKETEWETWITLAGIEFRVVIDRIDEVDGQSVILDYKTGKATVNALLKTPLKAPQLAVYLHAADKADREVAGIGYGLLHSDDGAALNALAAEEIVLGKRVRIFARLAEKEGGDFYEVAWPDFLESLKAEVLELAAAVQQGEAVMRFDKPADVAYAAGWLALRLPEAESQLAEAGIWKETVE